MGYRTLLIIPAGLVVKAKWALILKCVLLVTCRSDNIKLLCILQCGHYMTSEILSERHVYVRQHNTLSLNLIKQHSNVVVMKLG